jgi:hypothetical protein
MVGWVTLATDFLAAMTREDDGQLIETFQGVGLMRQKLAILASAVGRSRSCRHAALLWVRSRDQQDPLVPSPTALPAASTDEIRQSCVSYYYVVGARLAELSAELVAEIARHSPD